MEHQFWIIGLFVLALALALSPTMLPSFFAILSAASVAITSFVIPVTDSTLALTPDQTAPAVAVKNGSYRGFYSSSYNQDFFLGIPYAQVRLPDPRDPS